MRALLMGGQACVFHGAAELGRDIDFALLADSVNVNRLRRALSDLQAERIAVPPFEAKYLRRGHAVHFRCGDADANMSLPDLVQAKKTQRDKDWPMLRRLVEAHYFAQRDRPTSPQVAFWLRETRTPELLVEVTRRFPGPAQRERRRRPLLRLAERGQDAGLAAALRREEDAERAADAAYWVPLRAELEKLRHERVRATRSQAG